MQSYLPIPRKSRKPLVLCHRFPGCGGIVGLRVDPVVLLPSSLAPVVGVYSWSASLPWLGGQFFPHERSLHLLNKLVIRELSRVDFDLASKRDEVVSGGKVMVRCILYPPYEPGCASRRIDPSLDRRQEVQEVLVRTDMLPQGFLRFGYPPVGDLDPTSAFPSGLERGMKLFEPLDQDFSVVRVRASDISSGGSRRKRAGAMRRVESPGPEGPTPALRHDDFYVFDLASCHYPTAHDLHRQPFYRIRIRRTTDADHGRSVRAGQPSVSRVTVDRVRSILYAVCQNNVQNRCH